MEDRHFRAHAEPLFRKALALKRVTAWVCVNDAMALVAQDYLKARKIGMPQRLSLIGFDDTMEAFGQGLSSYNFNVANVVQTMLGHLLKPSRKSETAAAVELPGIVMQRTTSGPVRRQAGSVSAAP
jgi:DNA-binding LacI/PurR family transcriptional regulator